VYRTKGRYGDEKKQQQQQQQVADRFTYMSVLVFTQCIVSATVARLGTVTTVIRPDRVGSDNAPIFSREAFPREDAQE